VIGRLINIYGRMAKLFEKPYKKSYSQCGEDLIIRFIFDQLKISRPTYLDIGAHHPTWLSNTYLFYRTGSSGVCVEPDPDCFASIQRARKRDICLKVGIGTDDRKYADFFIMTSRTLNTFSRKEAELSQNTRAFGEQKIEKIIQIPVRTVNDIMEEYLPNGVNLISLDVEGLDFEIVRTFDFDRFRPEVFCIETLQPKDDGSLRKSERVADFMRANDYLIYADTYINTIFVCRRACAALIDG
jgi:FkbM family methyltransferase